jgi:hypothetical protein
MKETADRRWKKYLQWFILSKNRHENRALFFPYPDSFSDAGALNRIFQFEGVISAQPKAEDTQLVPPFTYLNQLRKFL